MKAVFYLLRFFYFFIFLSNLESQQESPKRPIDQLDKRPGASEILTLKRWVEELNEESLSNIEKILVEEIDLREGVLLGVGFKYLEQKNYDKALNYAYILQRDEDYAPRLWGTLLASYTHLEKNELDESLGILRRFDQENKNNDRPGVFYSMLSKVYERLGLVHEKKEVDTLLQRSYPNHPQHFGIQDLQKTASQEERFSAPPPTSGQLTEKTSPTEIVSLQVGLFTAPENAKRHMEQLQRLGYLTYQREVSVDGIPMFAVLLDSTDPQKDKKELRQQGFSAFVKTLP